MNSLLNSNMKAIKIAACCALFIALANLNAFAAPSIGGDEYSEPTPGATAEANKDIMDKDRANLACHGSLCTLFSVTSNKKQFTITARLGDQSGQSGGTNNYYGNTQTGTGGGALGVGYGLQLTWDKTSCKKDIDVDKSVYDAVTTYMRELLNSTPGEPSTYPQFTPAEQTMLLFYTTVMGLTGGSGCN